MDTLKLGDGIFGNLNTNVVVIPSSSDFKSIREYITDSLNAYAMNERQFQTLEQWEHLLPELKQA